MTTKRPHRKFVPQQNKIEELERNSPRFKRVYEEYELMSDELWTMENNDSGSIPDDFIDAVKLQTEFLESEIGDWLSNEKSEKSSN